MSAKVGAKSHREVWFGISRRPENANGWYSSTHAGCTAVYGTIPLGKRLLHVWSVHALIWLFPYARLKRLLRVLRSALSSRATSVEIHFERQAFMFKTWRTGETLVFIAYVDGNWAGDFTIGKSVSGCLLMLGGAALSWEAWQAELAPLSSTESEYINLCTGIKESTQISRLAQCIPGSQAAKAQQKFVWTTPSRFRV